MKKSCEKKRKYTDVAVKKQVLIVDFLLKCANINFGLFPSDVKKLGYRVLFCKILQKYQCLEKSISNFLKRITRLTIRSQEVTTLSRATSFILNNVQQFIDKYRSDLSK